jgi:ParB/RepB/Spo0J family partition protein
MDVQVPDSITKLQNIALEKITSTCRNPRSDLVVDDDLRGLAASLGTAENSGLVGPPVVEQLDEHTYRVLAGERRVQAARLAGWHAIACLVRPLLDPLKAHNLRLVENLHRQPLHPLDRAVGLKIAWLNANAEALELAAAAREILKRDQPPLDTLMQLTTLLEEVGFAPTHPAVSWDVVLDQLGIELNPFSRKKLLAVLAIEPGVQKQVRSLHITEAALRSLGQLEPEDQATLVGEMIENPDLTRRVRRISHAVRQHGYGIGAAIAEAQGKVVHDNHPEQEPIGADDFFADDTMDTVLQLLEAANQVTAAVQSLDTLLAGGRLTELPTPWSEYAVESLQLILTAVQSIH